MTGRPIFARELYKYYTEISSLQSTLPSPVQFKIGPDVFMLKSNVKWTWSVFRIKDFELLQLLCGLATFIQTKGFAEWLNQKNSQMFHAGHLFAPYNTYFLHFLCTLKF